MYRVRPSETYQRILQDYEENRQRLSMLGKGETKMLTLRPHQRDHNNVLTSLEPRNQHLEQDQVQVGLDVPQENLKPKPQKLHGRQSRQVAQWPKQLQPQITFHSYLTNLIITLLTEQQRFNEPHQLSILKLKKSIQVLPLLHFHPCKDFFN